MSYQPLLFEHIGSRSSFVIPGLGPGIHESVFVDGRAKPGHDE